MFRRPAVVTALIAAFSITLLQPLTPAFAVDSVASQEANPYGSKKAKALQYANEIGIIREELARADSDQQLIIGGTILSGAFLSWQLSKVSKNLLVVIFGPTVVALGANRFFVRMNADERAEAKRRLIDKQKQLEAILDSYKDLPVAR